MATELKAFLSARDFLLTRRADYAAAYRDFRWPELNQFNWALDYFDVMARGNEQPALWVVDEDGGEVKLSFALMSERSSRVANWLRAQGVGRGDVVLAMLGNTPPLWELMLACIKLGGGDHSRHHLVDHRRSQRPLRAGTSEACRGRGQ